MKIKWLLEPDVNLFNFSEAAREGGDVLIGDHDIAVEVDADDGYDFQ